MRLKNDFLSRARILRYYINYLDLFYASKITDITDKLRLLPKTCGGEKQHKMQLTVLLQALAIPGPTLNGFGVAGDRVRDLLTALATECCCMRRFKFSKN